jgi:Ca2+-binding EF-hand superfamily protein
MGCRYSAARSADGEEASQERRESAPTPVRTPEQSPQSASSRYSYVATRRGRASWVVGFRLGSIPFKTIVEKRFNSKITKAKESQVLEKLGRTKGIVLQKIITDREVSDDYVVTDTVLGMGLAGEVRLAHHKQSKKQVAIKTLKKKGISDEDLEMLLTEVQVVLVLDHPNVCRVYGVYEQPTEVTLILEYCTGGDMYNRLKDRKRYTEYEVKYACNQMFEAVNYLYQQMIVHRDIKLENWLYTSGEMNSLRLIDFGFATLFNQNEKMHRAHGTPYYIAPEVIRESYDAKCDIWSIGVVTYMLLSGAPPFVAPTDRELLRQVLHAPLLFPSPRWDGIHEDSMAFCEYLLNRNAEDRPSASEALSHPWLRDVERRSSLMRQVTREDVTLLLDFACQNDLRRATLGVLADAISGSDVEAEQVFLGMDQNQSGTIQLSDFLELAGVYGISAQVAHELFGKLDLKENNEIHFSEFLAAYKQISLLRDEAAIQRAFEVFDTDHSGYISAENLRGIFGHQFTGTKIEAILIQAGCDNPRGLPYEKFVEAVRDSRDILQVERPVGEEVERPVGGPVGEEVFVDQAVHEKFNL